MAGFDDVIEGAMPYVDTERMAGTQGLSWEWGYSVVDSAGDPVNMTSGYTATMNICTAAGSIALAPTVTFPAAGQIHCAASATATAALAPGTYFHELTVTRTSDSKKALIVGAFDSEFVVKQKVA